MSSNRRYAQDLFLNQDAVLYKGLLDCSTNPNYPAASAGFFYVVSVAGKVGGASGISVGVGDTVMCLVDGTAAGNQATVGANWTTSARSPVIASLGMGPLIGVASLASPGVSVLPSTITVPANLMKPLDHLQLQLALRLVQNSGGSRGCTTTLKAGSTSLAVSVASVAASTTIRHLLVNFDVTFYAAASQWTTSRAEVSPNVATTGGSAGDSTNLTAPVPTPTTVDFASAQNLDVSFFSTNDTGQFVQLMSALLVRVPAP